MVNRSVIVDSDIIIWYLRGMPEITNTIRSLISQSILFVNPIIIAEIFAGAKKNEEEIISKMFSSMHIIEINEDMGKMAGRYLNKFSKSHGLKIADAVIAASATYGKMNLWTLNKKHYPMFNKNDFYEIRT